MLGLWVAVLMVANKTPWPCHNYLLWDLTQAAVGFDTGAKIHPPPTTACSVVCPRPT